MHRVDNPMVYSSVPYGGRKAWSCGKCKGEMYGGEVQYEWKNRWICGECLVDIVHEMKVSDLADALNLEVLYISYEDGGFGF